MYSNLNTFLIRYVPTNVLGTNQVMREREREREKEALDTLTNAKEKMRA
jgi:hypothetical protein